MKLLYRLLGALALSVGLLGGSPLAGATTKKKETPAKVARKEPAQKKSNVKTSVKRKSSETKAVGAKNKGAGQAVAEKKQKTTKANAKEAASGGCKVVRVKTAKRTRSKHACAAAPAEPLLTSNVDGSALTKPAPEGKEPEIKARTVPERAYAVDGETFFFQGRKFRVKGLNGESGSEMAKQRLQKALDSGSLMVDPVSVDASGAAVASVRVNGRRLEEVLAQP